MGVTRINSGAPLLQSCAVSTARFGSSVFRQNQDLFARIHACQTSFAKSADDFQGHLQQCSLRQLSSLWVQPQGNLLPWDMDRMPSPALSLARTHACSRQLACANACRCVLASFCACVTAFAFVSLQRQPACVKLLGKRAR
jgi:hypothetical protein